jgi:hypothetical protein
MAITGRAAEATAVRDAWFRNRNVDASELFLTVDLPGRMICQTIRPDRASV